MSDDRRVFLSPPHMGGQEQVYVDDVFKVNYIGPVGEMLGRFEEAVCGYTGFKYAVAVASGTAAMHLALRHLGVGPGDVVVASTLTFIGSVSPATFQGAEIVFIDAEEESWNMDPVLLEQTLKDLQDQGRRPAAVIPTDLYGQCCNLSAILDVCDRFGVPVICDSAEAMGAKYRTSNIEHRTLNIEKESCECWVHAGRGAEAAVFSFNGNKIITSGGGGMLVSDDKEMIEHARKLATQSRDPVPYYQHTEIGYNYRLSNLCAAVGVGQMEVLDERVEKRRIISDWYRELLGDINELSFMPEPEWSRGNRWLTVAQVNKNVERSVPMDIIEKLAQNDIEARPVWKPMHMQPVFSDCKKVGGKVSEVLFENGVCLPSGSALEYEDVKRVAGIVRSCF